MPERHRIKTLLAFDFGMKRIGIAVGQTLTSTAEPLAVIPARQGVPDWETIQSFINSWNPDILIVGVPYNMDGTPQPLTCSAKRFSQKLQRFNLPVYTVDERLSTIAAKHELRERGIRSKSRMKEQLDSHAAKLILEQWLRDQS